LTQKDSRDLLRSTITDGSVIEEWRSAGHQAAYLTLLVGRVTQAAKPRLSNSYEVSILEVDASKITVISHNNNTDSDNHTI